MENFIYCNPTKIIFGEGQIEQIKGNIDRNKKVLFLYGGGSIKSNGVYQQVVDALSEHQFFEFSGIEANPEYETCLKAIEFVKENNIDFILAVGGGSVLDASKFIAAAPKYDGQAWDILTKQVEIKDALPIGAVLTLPATGSEMNGNSVISRREYGKKLAFSSTKVFPVFSVLDPTVTYSLPDRQLANGVVDAFVHVMEQYLTYDQSAPLQDRFAESILCTLLEEGDKLLSDLKDYNVRANIMWCATMALNTLIGQGVKQDWSTHMIGHELTAVYGLDHAQTLAIILPNMMEYKQDKKKDKLIQYADRVLGISKELSSEEKIKLAIEKTRSFFEKMGNKTTLSSYGVDIDALSNVLNNLEENKMLSLGEHQDIKLEDSKKILEMCI